MANCLHFFVKESFSCRNDFVLAGKSSKQQVLSSSRRNRHSCLHYNLSMTLIAMVSKKQSSSAAVAAHRRL